MSVTIGGNTIPLTPPFVDNPGLMESFLKLWDGQATAIGSALTITTGAARAVYQWSSASGSTATLPAATGSLMELFFYVSVLATTNSHIVKCSPATDTFIGPIFGARTDSTNVVLGFFGVTGGSNSNTITLNRSTTGSVNVGEWVWLQDAASGIWRCAGMLSATGASFATPFSHV